MQKRETRVLAMETTAEGLRAAQRGAEEARALHHAAVLQTNQLQGEVEGLNRSNNELRASLQAKDDALHAAQEPQEGSNQAGAVLREELDAAREEAARVAALHDVAVAEAAQLLAKLEASEKREEATAQNLRDVEHRVRELAAGEVLHDVQGTVAKAEDEAATKRAQEASEQRDVAAARLSVANAELDAVRTKLEGNSTQLISMQHLLDTMQGSRDMSIEELSISQARVAKLTAGLEVSEQQYAEVVRSQQALAAELAMVQQQANHAAAQSTEMANEECSRMQVALHRKEEARAEAAQTAERLSDMYKEAVSF